MAVDLCLCACVFTVYVSCPCHCCGAYLSSFNSICYQNVQEYSSEMEQNVWNFRCFFLNLYFCTQEQNIVDDVLYALVPMLCDDMMMLMIFMSLCMYVVDVCFVFMLIRFSRVEFVSRIRCIQGETVCAHTHAH